MAQAYTDEFGNVYEENAGSAFSHNGNTQTPSSSEEFTLDILPNILDNYDTQTYHWKLFITTLEDATSGNVLNTDRQVIIAESGVTDLTIDKIELQAIAVPSSEVGTGTQTAVKFEIVEPAGAGLLDKLYYEAVSLGIGNWLVMPCFLELTFRGRDPATSVALESGGPAPLSNLRWVWPIKLTDTKANVTHVGTRYDFTAIIYGELAQSNAYFSLLHNVKLSNLVKFGPAMAYLQDKLNADQIEKLYTDYSIPDTYRIVVDPKLADISLVVSDQNKNTYRSGDEAKLHDKTATYSAGTGIDKIIDSLLTSTEYFQKKMRAAETRAGAPGTATTAPDQMKKVWRVITESKPIKFDPMRQDNAVAHTIYIVEYDIGMLDVSPAQTAQTPDTLPAAKKRFAEYTDKKILKKLYNYIFTGLNDQVLNFDLTLNFAFATIISRFAGIYVDSGTQVPGMVAQNRAEEELRISKQVKQTFEKLNNAETVGDRDNLVNEMVMEIDKSNISAESKARTTKLLNMQKSLNKTAIRDQLSAIQDAGGVNADPSLNNRVSLANSLAKSKSVNNLAFISDVNLGSTAAEQARIAAEALAAGKLRPIPFREGNKEYSSAYSIDPNTDSGRAKTSSVFAQALYSAMDANLQSIKITIKGDPFWLFPQSIDYNTPIFPYLTNMSDSEAIKKIKYAQIDMPGQVNLFGTDNFIIIRFRTPRIYNETTGVIDPFTEVETFSGVYKVIRVTSKFEMGKFSQELECILDPIINLRDFLKSVENSIKKSGDGTSSNAQPNQTNRPRQIINEPQNEVTVKPPLTVSPPTTAYPRGGAGAGATANAKSAIDFFISKGWTPEQAAGIVGNLQAESGANLKINALGDKDKAYGIAQWHPKRQNDFKTVYGKDIRNATFEEQLEFVQWELGNTEKKAGNYLKTATTAEKSAEVVDQYYERSSGAHRSARILNAQVLMKQQGS
jgi:hypothetical protein